MFDPNFRFAFVLGAAALVGACTGNTPEDPPDGAIRFIHAAPSVGSVDFLTVEFTQGAFGYGGSSATFVADEGPYTINAEIANPDTPTGLIRIISEERRVTAPNELLLVLFDDGPEPAFTQYELPLTEVETGNTEIVLLHAARGAAPVDIYIEADGADLMAATPRETLAFKEIGTPFLLAAGQYRVTATPVGDPITVLYQTPVFSPTDAESSVIAILAGAGTTRSPLRANALNRTSATPVLFEDSSATSSLRLVNGAVTIGPVDVYANADFGAPVHGNVAARGITDYVDVAGGQTQLQVTPAGNTGVIESDVTPALVNGAFQTQVIAGPTGSVTTAVYAEDNRGISSRARFRIRNAAATFPLLDVYLTAPGTDITDDDINPLQSQLPVSGFELTSLLQEGDFELTFVENDNDADTIDTTIVGGPIPVTWLRGRVYEVYVFDSDTAGQVDVQIGDVTAPLP
ncbi:MAG: DUF4397 domain-containing protein [Pseudomonadota bacterium]